jgi:hypothetical protein
MSSGPMVVAAPRWVAMVRSASPVTSTRQRPVPATSASAPPGPPAAAPVIGSYSTPDARMSWMKTLPRASAAILPTKADRPPSAATPAAVLAAEPPEASTAGPRAP